MKLTAYTDYALRTLMHLADNRDQRVTIQDIAALHNIAKNHLTKVVHQLSQLEVIESVRGRNGGLRLGKEPTHINIGAVIRSTETDFSMAECFNPESNACILTPACKLKGLLHSATAAYMAVLDSVTLEDLMRSEHGSTNTVHSVSVKSIRLQPSRKA